VLDPESQWRCCAGSVLKNRSLCSTTSRFLM
jgi:hypothetical protein